MDGGLDLENAGTDWARTMETMELTEGENSVGSKRENAYSLFEHLDADGDRRICSWELASFFPSAIGCTREKIIELAFFCGSLGLTVEEDEEGMVVVAGWKEDSPAAEHPSLMVGMRILSIDGWDLPCALSTASGGVGPSSRYQSCLRKCERVLEACSTDTKTVHVLEVSTPAVVVTTTNRWLDMDVGGDVIAVNIPLGVYLTEEAFFSALQEAGRDQHPKLLQFFGVKYDRAQPFAVLSVGGSPFKLLWSSGKHQSKCCRRLLHYHNVKDTEYRMSHTTGRRDTFAIEGTQQRLSLKPRALTAFAEHIILETREKAGKRGDSRPLGDEDAFLEFEDFLTLYTTYLSSQEGLWRARDLMMVGFMGEEESALVLERQAIDQLKRKRLRRMIKRRQFNKERKRLQLARMIDTGAHLRIGGVIHVQKRGASTQTLHSPPHTSEQQHDQTGIGGPDERQLAVVSQPEDERSSVVSPPGEGSVRSERTGRAGRRDDKPGGETSVDRKTLKISVAKNTGVHSEEALAERMDHLRSQRDRTKVLKRTQEKAMKARALKSMNETETFEATLGGAGQWGTSKRTLELAKLGLEDCRSGQTGKRPQPEDIHPAFLGYFHKRGSNGGPWDPTVRSPVFFGVLSGALTKVEATRGGGDLAALKVLLNLTTFDSDGGGESGEGEETSGRHRDQRVCLTFPLAPVTRGRVRQRLREVGEAYDRAALVHPSCFGLMTIPDVQDCRHQSPVFFGYDLARKPTGRGRGGDVAEEDKPQREDFVAHREGKPCPVCLVGKPGCPCCWNFPEGWTPHDFAYLGPFKDAARQASSRPSSPGVSRGGSVASAPGLGTTPRAEEGWPAGVGGGVLITGGLTAEGNDRRGRRQAEEEDTREKPEFQTDLTTTAAIGLYRAVVACIIRIFVKVIPCGTATCLRMDSSWPVSYLYDLWRANALEGNTVDAFMFLPTMTGQWNLDNRNLAETDTTLGVHTGELPISKYNLKATKSTVTVLCTTFFSVVKTKESIMRYLVYETGVGKKANMEVFDHLVGLPTHPENDPIQKALCGLMEHRVAQQEQVDDKDARAELAVRNALLLDAEKARKEAVLAIKRHQVAHGSKEWRATKRQERDEEEAAAAAALLDEATDAPLPLPLTETPIAGLNPTRNGRQRTRTKNGKKSGLPGAGVENIGGELGGDGGQSGTGTGSRAIALMGGKLSKLNLGFTKKNAPKEKPQRGYI